MTPAPDAKTNALLAEVRDDVEALLEDLVAGEVDREVAALWAGEQANELTLAGAFSGAMKTDPVLIETLAVLTDLSPRLVPLEVKPGTFERMLKRLRESPVTPPRGRSAGR